MRFCLIFNYFYINSYCKVLMAIVINEKVTEKGDILQNNRLLIIVPKAQKYIIINAYST